MPTDPTAQPSAPSRVTARRLGFVALAVVLVGVVVAGVVFAVSVVGLAGWRGGAAEDTASILRSAARSAEQSTDPAVGAGRYLRVTIHAVSLASGDDGEHTYSWLDQTTEHQYLPADLDDDWVWVRPLPRPISGFDARSLAYATKSYDDTIAESPDGDGIVRAAGGAFYGADPEWGPRQLGTLPEDPRDLLNEIYRTLPESNLGADADAFRFLADRLTSGYADGAQRALLFRALVLIPGVKTAASRASWGDGTGVAIERDEGQVHDQLLVDPDRGVALGQRQIQMKRLDLVPAGTAIGWTNISLDVVDSAPAGGTVCGSETGMKLVDGNCMGGV